MREFFLVVSIADHSLTKVLEVEHLCWSGKE